MLPSIYLSIHQLTSRQVDLVDRITPNSNYCTPRESKLLSEHAQHRMHGAATRQPPRIPARFACPSAETPPVSLARGPAHGRPAARRCARRPRGGVRAPSPPPLLLGPQLQQLAQRTALRGESLARAPQERVQRVPLAQPLCRGGLPLRLAPQPLCRGERCLQACHGGREAGGLSRMKTLVRGSRSTAP